MRARVRARAMKARALGNELARSKWRAPGAPVTAPGGRAVTQGHQRPNSARQRAHPYPRAAACADGRDELAEFAHNRQPGRASQFPPTDVRRHCPI